MPDLDKIMNALETIAGIITIVLSVIAAIQHNGLTTPTTAAAAVAAIGTYGLHHAQSTK